MKIISISGYVCIKLLCQGRTQDFGRGVSCSSKRYRAQSARRNFAKPRPLISESILGWRLYETSDMQLHRGMVWGNLGYRNESKSKTNASFATGCCTMILKWLTLAVLITRGRGSISPSPSWCRGGFRATRKQLRYAPALQSLYDIHTLKSTVIE